MSRLLKQFLYGILYLSLFILIGSVLFRSLLPAKDSCFDGRKNKGEVGVDCGGPCLPCGTTPLQDLLVLEQARKLGLASGHAVFIARISNPNAGLGADPLHYSFDLYGRIGLLLESVSGRETLAPQESKYVVGAPAKSAFSEIDHVELRLGDVTWKKEERKLRQPKAVGVATYVSGNKITIKGRIQNESPSDISEVKIIAILFDAFETELFAAQTLIANVPAQGEKEFAILFPQDSFLRERVNPSATRVFVYPK